MPGQNVDDYLEVLVSDLQRKLESSIAGGPYQVTNGPAVRTLDASTATIEQTARFVATLAQDLRKGRILS
jgi:hypothetical protein